MDTTRPVEALLATVDAVLRGNGTDPDTVTDDDKVMLAVQYVEVASTLGIAPVHIQQGVFRL